MLTMLIDVVADREPAGGDLDRLASAVSLAEEVGDLADRLVGHYVDKARAGGATWSQIGEQLGVSKQAAQQRSVSAAFDRYTGRAKTIMGAAQDFAKGRGQSSVSPAMLLLAMCRDADSLAARTLAAHDVDPAELADELAATVASIGEPVAGRPGFTVAGKQVVDQAPREALKLGHNYVGTEHLLLAVLRQPEALPADVVARIGLTYEAAGVTIEQLLEQLSRPKLRRRPKPPPR